MDLVEGIRTPILWSG
jgi:hypothetical protein